MFPNGLPLEPSDGIHAQKDEEGAGGDERGCGQFRGRCSA